MTLEQRWTEYATAHARLHLSSGITVEAGPVSGLSNHGEFPDRLGRTIHVITADNPGIDVSREANAAAHSRLVDRANELGWDYVHAHGGDPAWTHVEACLAVFGADSAEVAAVGREFHQDAIFEWSPAQWSLVMCDHSMREDFAWRAWTVGRAAGGPLAPRSYG